MKKLNRDDILNKQDLPREEVYILEWDGSVWVRGMTGHERDRFEMSVTSGRGASTTINLENARAKLVALTVVDEAGERLFTEDDVTALSKKSAIALNKLFEVSQRLSGLSNSDVKELTDTLKNEVKGDSTLN
jgi:hypothetical protein